MTSDLLSVIFALNPRAVSMAMLRDYIFPKAILTTRKSNGITLREAFWLR